MEEQRTFNPLVQGSSPWGGTMVATVDTTSGVFVALTVIGTIAFATSGVMAAAEASFDWLGALVLAVVVAVGGGTLRDVILGRPVSWVTDEWPVVVALGTAVAGILVLRIKPHLEPHESWPFLMMDTIGLATFVVLGASISLESGTSAFVAVLMGVVTGVGGGIVRDVLSGQRPIVFVGQLYAIPGILGASIHTLLDGLDVVRTVTVWLPVAFVVVLRTLAVRGDWHLPRVVPAGSSGESSNDG